jgi:hypothetical protein
MTGCAVPRRRSFPFGEHRSMAQVLETERLVKLKTRGEIAGWQARKLYSLQSRATEPENDNHPEPAA